MVQGKTVTSWPSIQQDLKNAGALWIDKEVVCDGTLVTSRSPEDLEYFNQKMVEVFLKAKIHKNQALMGIRHAHMEDAPALLSLMEQLGYPVDFKEIHKRLNEYLLSPNHMIMVAEHETDLAGFIAVSIVYPFIQSGKRARIEALIVDKSFRRQGIGKKLVEAAEYYAHDNGCEVIDVTTGQRRAGTGAHEFYRNLGYSNDGYWASLYLKKELVKSEK